MRKQLSLLFVAMCLVAMHTYAQQPSGDPNYELYAWSQKKYTFTIQPFQFFMSGLKLDFEMRLGDGPGWLQFSPSVYYSDKSKEKPGYYYIGKRYNHHYQWEIREPYSKLSGGGLEVNYKRFLNARRTFYTAAGITYTHFAVGYWGWKWADYIEDGLQYHSFAYGLHTQHINRVGINSYFGIQIPTRRFFVYDMFWGLSYRHSFTGKDMPDFNENIFSFGYTGFVLIAGFRIGVGIR
jgi:hypothetical protein